jgi:hypothetical protein
MVYLMTLEALMLYSIKWRDYPPVQLHWDSNFRILAVATPKFVLKYF